jgi:membrane-associated phospholipid phosphatase
MSVRLAIAAGTVVLNAAIYLVPNRLQLLPARLLPWTPLDAAVPFVPQTVWLYLSDYVLVAIAFLLCRTRSEVKRFAVGYYLVICAAAAVHFLWPTRFPRELFAAAGDTASAAVLSVLWQIDSPASCLPSMHVAQSYFAALSLWWRGPWLRAGWLLWATLVALSTLTTKQHYAVDVAAGLALGVLTAGLFYGRTSRASRWRWSSISMSQHPSTPR